jgi:putative acetyltransferase
MNLIQAINPDEVALARQLFEEYASWIEISLCFQGFDKELAGLPGDYAPPKGRLLLAIENDQPAQVAGCIALRPLSDNACEMKRLYVRPRFRGRGLGRELVAAVVEAAREIGYESMRLDTLPGKMDQALAMYRRFGFKEIEPYYENPVVGATFMELSLA